MGSHQSLAHLSWTLPPGRVSCGWEECHLGSYADLPRSHLQSHQAWGLSRGQGNRAAPRYLLMAWEGHFP